MNNHGHADTAGVDAWCVETGWEGHLGSDSDETRRGIDGSFLAPGPRGVRLPFTLCVDLARSFMLATAGGTCRVDRCH